MLKKLKVLIVEDEKEICETLKILMEDRDYESVCVSSGEEAFKILEKESFDLVLVDIRLPGIDGVTFIKEAHDFFPHLKFIIFTGSIDFDVNAVKSLPFVCDTVIYKPILDTNFFFDTIEKFLGIKR